MDVFRTSNIDLYVNRKTTGKGHSATFDATARNMSYEPQHDILSKKQSWHH